MKAFKLENEPKIESGFKTPDHYFENFSEKLMHQLPEKEPKVISLFQKNKKFFLLVAAVLILALFVPIFYVSTIATSSNEIDSTTLENYLSYQSSVNQYDLIDGLEPDEISNIKAPVALEDATIEDLLVVNANLENLIIE
jgi:3-deoxy-D-arabino-heptulosonate 7-phosphate (DAHP) synthase class II